jgi:hypothetical protein
LAGWANPEELQTMRHRLESALRSDAFLKLPDYTITNLHHARAPSANQMMLMAVTPFVNQGKPGYPISEVKSLHEIETLQ